MLTFKDIKKMPQPVYFVFRPPSHTLYFKDDEGRVHAVSWSGNEPLLPDEAKEVLVRLKEECPVLILDSAQFGLPRPDAFLLEVLRKGKEVVFAEDDGA